MRVAEVDEHHEVVEEVVVFGDSFWERMPLAQSKAVSSRRSAREPNAESTARANCFLG